MKGSSMAEPAKLDRVHSVFPEQSVSQLRGNPARQAYAILYWGFVALPIIAGFDKFFGLLTDWTKYLAPFVARIIPASTFMPIVGIVEIIAGVLVALKPRVGAYVVALWLWGIIINLILTG